MDKLTEHYRKQFYRESEEILEAISDDILKAEADPENRELLNSVFRGIHTIKGSAGSFELDTIAEFAHHLEGLLGALRDGKLSMTPEITDLVLAGADQIGKMIRESEAGRTPDIDSTLVGRFRSFYTEADLSLKHIEKEAETDKMPITDHSFPPEILKSFQEAASLGLFVFGVRVKYSSDLLENGYDPLIFLNNLKQSATSFYAETISNPVPASDTFNPLHLYLHPTVFVATTLSEEEIASLSFDPSLTEIRRVLVPTDKDNIEHLHEFVDSATEMLESLEKAVIEYETGGSRDALNDIFRIVHNLKGDADMVGLGDITVFAHALESLLDRLRSGNIQRSFALVDVILQSVDFLRQSVMKLENGADIPEFPPVFETLKNYAAIKDDLEKKQDLLKDISPDIKAVFIEQADQYRQILQAHIADINADTRKIIDRTLTGLIRASDVVGLKSLQTQASKALGVRSDKLLRDFIEKISAFIEGLRSEPKEKIVETGEEISYQKKDASADVRTMRIDERKVDYFTNMVGELLIARNTYTHLVDQLKHVADREMLKAFKDNLHLFSRLTNDIQHGVMSLRMIPIGRIFQKFNRVIRDLSRRQHKLIQLMTGGDDIEIDKKIADALSDPLIHLIRNACDHGIELPEIRRSAGKPEKGTIIIRASQEGSNLCIRVIDDGRGINRKKLFEKAKQLGINVSSDDPDLPLLAFTPGLSTRERISDISGRGVGLDVVQTSVRALGGKVGLMSHEGKGLEITLSIPITLGTNSVLFVESQGILYAVPLEAIVETLKIPAEKFRKSGKSLMFHHRGEVLAAQRLETLLNPASASRAIAKTDECSVVILKTQMGKIGVIVDRLNRNTDIAIKSVPTILSEIDIISGVSIMGDGKVFLVLDPERLVIGD